MASSHHFAHRHQVSARLARVTKFQLVWHRLCDVVLFRSSCRFENTLTAVCALPEYQSCQYSLRSNICEHLNGLHIFDQTDLYRFEVRLELYGANARLVVNNSPPSFSISIADATAKPMASSHYFNFLRQVSARLVPPV